MPKNNSSTATVGFEAELWRAADALRSNMDADEYSQSRLGYALVSLENDLAMALHDTESIVEQAAVEWLACARSQSRPADARSRRQ